MADKAYYLTEEDYNILQALLRDAKRPEQHLERSRDRRTRYPRFTALAKTNEQIAARSGTTQGVGQCTIYEIHKFDGLQESGNSPIISGCENVTTNAIPDDTYVWLIREPNSGRNLIIPIPDGIKKATLTATLEQDGTATGTIDGSSRTIHANEGYRGVAWSGEIIDVVWIVDEWHAIGCGTIISTGVADEAIALDESGSVTLSNEETVTATAAFGSITDEATVMVYWDIDHWVALQTGQEELELGCGLEYDGSSGKLKVKLSEIAGESLVINEDGECPLIEAPLIISEAVLQADLAEGDATGVNALVGDSTSSETVKGEVFIGYAWSGQTITVAWIDGEWQAISGGSIYLYGLTNEAKDKGESISVTLSNTETISAVAKYSGIPNEADVLCLWDSGSHQWHAIFDNEGDIVMTEAVLQADLVEGEATGVNATIDAGTETVKGNKGFRGYAWSGETIVVAWIGSEWQAVNGGSIYLSGETDEEINLGETGNVTLSNEEQVTARAKFTPLLDNTKVLVLWDSGDNEWHAIAGDPQNPHALFDHTDTTGTEPSDLDIVIYDGQSEYWTNTPHVLETIKNVIITDPVAGQVLTFDGTNWRNEDPCCEESCYPEICVTAIGSPMAEDGEGASFRICRTGAPVCLDGELVVNFGLTGTAVLNTDYEITTGGDASSATIGIDASCVDLVISPIDNSSYDGTTARTIILTISAGEYDINEECDDGTITIEDDELPPGFCASPIMHDEFTSGSNGSINAQTPSEVGANQWTLNDGTCTKDTSNGWISHLGEFETNDPRYDTEVGQFTIRSRFNTSDVAYEGGVGIAYGHQLNIDSTSGEMYIVLVGGNGSPGNLSIVDGYNGWGTMDSTGISIAQDTIYELETTKNGTTITATLYDADGTALVGVNTSDATNNANNTVVGIQGWNDTTYESVDTVPLRTHWVIVCPIE